MDEPREDAGTVSEPGDPADSGQQQQPDPIEAEARAKGWKPKEEFTGDVEDWQSAKRFLKTKELYDRVKKVDFLEKKLKEADTTLHKVIGHQQQIITGAVEAAIANLKAQKKEAIEAGDAERVEALDEQIDRQKALKQQAPEAATQIAPEVKAWLDDPANEWFHKDEELSAIAKTLDLAYRKKHGEFAIADSLKYVDAEIRKRFPEKFGDTRRDAPPPVEGNRRATPGNNRYSMSRLSPEQQIVCKQYVDSGVMTTEKYIKFLEAEGSLS